MKLHPGKSYIDRSGHIVGPLSALENGGFYQFVGLNHSDGLTCLFTDAGRFIDAETKSDSDLVSEHIDHAAENELLRTLLSEVMQPYGIYDQAVARCSGKALAEEYMITGDKIRAAIARASESGKGEG